MFTSSSVRNVDVQCVKVRKCVSAQRGWRAPVCHKYPERSRNGASAKDYAHEGQIFQEVTDDQALNSNPKRHKSNPRPREVGRRLTSLILPVVGAASVLSPCSSRAEDFDEIDKYFPPLRPENADAFTTAEDRKDDAKAGDTREVITDVVYLDIGVCPEGYRTDRTLGDKSALCITSEPLGRLLIGLYGQEAPATVRNFKKIVESGGYNGTIFSKVLPGEYIMAGRQGSKRMGEVAGLPELPPNDDLLNPRAFRLPHYRPGTVSLSLTENDDEPFVKQRPGYRNTEFLITTGPGPAPSLDGNNVVFGRVLDGLETVAAITRLPIFKPAERIQVLNKVASLIGDERAARVRAKYGRPLRSVVITDSGLVDNPAPASAGR
eukprot:jgi/Botrbrau1/18208/Bobra.53_1s0067.1